MLLLEPADAIVHLFQSHRVRVPHRPAAVGREAVAVDVDDVDVHGAEGDDAGRLAREQGQRVVADYQHYLGRSPSHQEINAWVDLFVNHGVSNESVIAGFAASPEYFQSHYDNIDDWVINAFADILGRQPDTAGYNAWVAFLKDN